MTYQTIVRSSNNELVVNQQVGIRVSILEDSVNGPMIYRETHTPTTNVNGLITIMIGEGIHPYTNTLADVKWDKHTHYLSVEIDPLGGTNYTIFGAQQMVSVPYAFYAESARIDKVRFNLGYKLPLHCGGSLYVIILVNSFCVSQFYSTTSTFMPLFSFDWLVITTRSPSSTPEMSSYLLSMRRPISTLLYETTPSL